jgi:hypothetical protein
MADNKTIDNGALTDYAAASDEVTYSGDTADVQLVKPAHVAGTEGAKTVEAVTQTVASAAPAAAVVVGGTDGTNVRHLKTDTSGELQVDVLTLPAIPAGTNNIGDVDVLTIAAGDNNIGNVDIVTMPNVTLAATTNTIEVTPHRARRRPAIRYRLARCSTPRSPQSQPGKWLRIRLPRGAG